MHKLDHMLKGGKMLIGIATVTRGEGEWRFRVNSSLFLFSD